MKVQRTIGLLFGAERLRTLPDDGDFAEGLAAVVIGDQVQMRGMLINYHPVGSPDMRRSTSTVRTDKGDGACEVFLVQDISILARGTPGWYAAWTFGLWFMWGLLAAKVLIFFAIPLEHYKKFSS